LTTSFLLAKNDVEHAVGSAARGSSCRPRQDFRRRYLRYLPVPPVARTSGATSNGAIHRVAAGGGDRQSDFKRVRRLLTVTDAAVLVAEALALSRTVAER